MIPGSGVSSKLLLRDVKVGNNLLVENQQRFFLQSTSILLSRLYFNRYFAIVVKYILEIDAAISTRLNRTERAWVSKARLATS